MLRFSTILVGAFLLSSTTAGADTWIFESGEYTRDPETGDRVAQYEDLPTIERIPYREYFSEDGPDPFGMDYWTDSQWSRGGWFDFGGLQWDSILHAPSFYPLPTP